MRPLEQATLIGERASIVYDALGVLAASHTASCKVCKDVDDGVQLEPCRELAFILHTQSTIHEDQQDLRLDLPVPRGLVARIRALVCRHSQPARVEHLASDTAMTWCPACQTVLHLRVAVFHQDLLGPAWRSTVKPRRK